MLVRDIREHVLVVSIFGKGIYSLLKVEEVPKQEIVIRCARLIYQLSETTVKR